MRDPNLILAVLSAVWAITVGLFIYIIKIKDTSEANTKSALEEIKLLIGTVHLNLATNKQALDSHIYTTRGIDVRVEKHSGHIHSLEIKVATLLENKVASERRIDILENQCNVLNK